MKQAKDLSGWSRGRQRSRGLACAGMVMVGATGRGAGPRAGRLPWQPLAVVLAVFAGAGPVSAQAVRVEVRAGLAVSSALAEDMVANPRLIAQLGTSYDGAVRAQPAPGPIFIAAAILPLRSRSDLELALGWTAAGLDAVDAAGTRRIQDIGVGQATVSVRYRLTGRLDAGCGFGALHYSGDGGLFEEGSDISPLVECGSGLAVTSSGIMLRASGQAHRFRTPVLQDAGAHSGTVFRLTVQAGYAFGRRR